MPSYQQRPFIEAALASVLAQSHANWELCIQDGGSTDGTVAYLERLAKTDPRIRFHSAPDAGPADALNKAAKRARGTLFAWLNSDDLLAPDAFSDAVRHFTENPRHLMVYGHGTHVNAVGEFVSDYPSLSAEDWRIQPDMTCRVCQPTVVFKRSLYIMLGPFDVSLKTAFDFDYWLRAFSCVSHRIGFIPRVRAHTRLHGETITSRMRTTVAIEGMKVVHRYAGYSGTHWVESCLAESKGVQSGTDTQESSDDWIRVRDQLLEAAHLFCRPDAIAVLKNRYPLVKDAHR